MTSVDVDVEMEDVTLVEDTPVCEDISVCETAADCYETRFGGTFFDDEGVTASRIPNEIWVKILSQLNQKEIVRGRTVCSTWRDVVDEHLSFSVVVHDDKTDLHRVYELRIRDCLVTKLIEDVNIFQYPELLRRLRFWGPINVRNVHRMLFQATKLEELSFTRSALALDNLMPPDSLVPFEKLLKLELLGYCCKEADEVVTANTVRIFSHHMPSLRKVFVNITCEWRKVDVILVSLFGLLAQHRKKITHLNTSLMASAGQHEVIPDVPTVIPEEVTDLVYNGELQLESLRLTLSTKYMSAWAPMIKNQCKLVDLRLHWSTSSDGHHNGTDAGIPCGILYPAITQSALTLVHVDLRDLILDGNDGRSVAPFDASIFACAQNVRRLVLVRHKDDCHRHVEPYGEASLKNINVILPLLEDLEIARFSCKSSDLQILVDNAPLLKTVKLQHTGMHDQKGVHGGILESVTNKEGIKTVNVCPMNCYDPEENKKYEAVKMRFPGICSGNDQINFDFDRFKEGKPQVVTTRPTPAVQDDQVAGPSHRHHVHGHIHGHNNSVRVIHSHLSHLPSERTHERLWAIFFHSYPENRRRRSARNSMRTVNGRPRHRFRHRSLSPHTNDLLPSESCELACSGNLRPMQPQRPSSSCSNPLN